MCYNLFHPPANLKDIVKYYWSFEKLISSDETYIHRTLANHCPELIFHYGGQFYEITGDKEPEKTFRSGIHGQTGKIRRFTAANTCGIFGVMLQPYAIPLLFGIPATEVKDNLVDLGLLLGQQADDLSEKVFFARDQQQRVLLVNSFLHRLLFGKYKQAGIISSVKLICSHKGNVNIKEAAGKANLSLRQFERNFKEYTGFTPKSFARLVRFKSLVDTYRPGNRSLTEIAGDFGYYDQSHFIEDFRSYSGYNPRAFFYGDAGDVFYAPK